MNQAFAVVFSIVSSTQTIRSQLLWSGLAAFLISISASAQTYKVLHNFGPVPGGQTPYSNVILDSAGNVYGTTELGGEGFGVVYRLDSSGNETVLHSFTGAPVDGANPVSGLVHDEAGNLYGTTLFGGASGNGAVFKVDPQGTETILYSFAGSPDGSEPWGGLARGAAGNLYGTTYYGGAYGGTQGYGTVFVLTATGEETVIHSFTGTGGDGEYPFAGLVIDSGAIYGTTYQGGAFGKGTLFKINRAGQESVLHSFTGGLDGGSPYFGYLVHDSAGNLYGTTPFGGKSNLGVVFRMDTAGNETILYNFVNSATGMQPVAGVFLDSKGNIYGTALGGEGVVYALNPAGNEKVLHSFDNLDGRLPYSDLARDPAGNLFGTTYEGGSYSGGVVFELSP